MPNQQPIITGVDGRRFTGSAAALLVFVVNEEEKLLLLSHPKREGQWEVINGALEAEETILEGALRETREEAGSEVRVRPLGTVHASTFRYDDNVQYMISLYYLMAYEGGQIRPGDDMEGSEFRWCSVDEMDENIQVIVPTQKWVMRRAIDLYRLWKEQEIDLECERVPL